MSQPDIPALKTRLLRERRGFVADAVTQALEDAEADGVTLSVCEYGMSEPTAYGQRVEAEAADEAEDIFNKILDGYLQVVASFAPSTNGSSALDYAADLYKGAQSDKEEDALERLLAAHDDFLRGDDHAQKRDHAQFLLKAPLEFSDSNTQDLLNRQDQKIFSDILGKLRHIAAL